VEFKVSQRTGLIALLLLWAMALGWLIAPFHFASSEHHWCDEHDQYEHNDAYAARRIENIYLGPSTIHQDNLLSLDRLSDSGSDSHVACQILGNIHRQKALPSTTSVASAHLPMRDSPALPSLMAFHRPEPLLSIAPKQSPPQMVLSHTA